MVLFIRSLIFTIIFFIWTAVFCISLTFFLPFGKPRMLKAVLAYMRSLLWLEKHLLNLTYEIRGAGHIPRGSFVLAAKHQSTWETMVLHLLLANPAIVLKQELLRIPFWGWYARHLGVIAVNRSGGNKAIRGLSEDALDVVAKGRAIAIFPQGTRVKPGDWREYKSGVFRLYEQLNVPILPMALNSGCYWPRHSLIKRPGKIVVEFLPIIPSGLSREEVTLRLVRELEGASNRLVEEAGGPITILPPKYQLDLPG
jgi:1-acyl-sn-glycerol-3-phosphate acyltransferase